MFNFFIIMDHYHFFRVRLVTLTLHDGRHHMNGCTTLK